MGATSSKAISVTKVFRNDDPSSVTEFLDTWGKGTIDLLSPLTQTEVAELQQNTQSGYGYENIKSHRRRDTKHERGLSAWVGATPLHIAAEHVNSRALKEMVRLLQNANQNNARRNDADTDEKQRQVLNWDIRDSAGLSPLARAVRAGNSTAIHVLLRAGSNPLVPFSTAKEDVQEPYCWSYLRYAAWHGKVRSVNALLGFDNNNREWGEDGKRPIHLAIQNGQFAAVEVLLQQDLESYCNEYQRAPVSSKKARALAIQWFLVRPPQLYEANLPASSLLEINESTEGSIRFAVPEVQAGDETRELLETLREALQAEVPANDGSTTDSNETEAAAKIVLRPPPNRDRGSTLLHLAAAYGHASILEYLISQPILEGSVNCINEFGKAAIFLAVRNGFLKCVKVFQDHGVSMNTVDIENWSILHEAVKYKHIDIVKYLLDNGANVNCEDDDGWTPVHVAARFGNASAVKPLQLAGGNMNAITEDRETPILLAIFQNKNSEVVRELLEHGAYLTLPSQKAVTIIDLIIGRKEYNMLATVLSHLNNNPKIAAKNLVDLNATLPGGQTLLHECVTANCASTIRELLALGADSNIRNALGDTPILHAIKFGSAAILKVLVLNGADANVSSSDGTLPVHVACDMGHAEHLQVLVHHGSETEWPVPVSAPNSGFTPLMLAARRGHLNCIKILTEVGVNLQARKGDGFTALHLTALNGHVDSLSCLLSAKAETNVAENNGFLPLHVAVRNQQAEAVSALLTGGTNPSSAGPGGLTALHFASYQCNAQILWLLIQCGAEINATEDNGATALHYAAQQIRGQSCLQLLLASGAKMNLFDCNGDTALHFASRRGMYQNVRVLLRRGSKVGLKNGAGLTALHLAAANGSRNTVSVLLQYNANGRDRDLNGTTPYQIATRARNHKARILIWTSMNLSVEDVAPATKYSKDKRPEPSSTDNNILRELGDEGLTLCVVCQNFLCTGDVVRTLPCQHTYHASCISGWFGGKLFEDRDTCPLCHKSVLSPDLPPPRR